MKISIIIPIYNIAPWLDRCLTSCRDQVYQNLEILCINDGSLDNSSDIIDFYCRIDSRFIHIKKSNEGLPAARKTGIEHASGEFIFHLDGDDWLPTDAVNNLVSKQISSNADMVIGNYHMKYDDASKDEFISKYEFDIISKESFIKMLLIENTFFVWGKLFRSSICKKLFIPQEIAYTEDVIAMIQLAFLSAKVAKVNASVYNYYQRENSYTHVVKKSNLLQWYKSNVFVKEYLTDEGIIEIVKNEFDVFYITQLIVYIKFRLKTGAYRDNVKSDLYSFWFSNANKNMVLKNIYHKDILLLRISLISVIAASLFYNLYAITIGKFNTFRTRNKK